MERVNLTDLVGFSEEEPARHDVLESERLWSQLLCLGRNQSYGPVRDHQADCLLLVLAGEAVVQVDRRRTRLRQWGATLAPAGAELAVTNASADPAVILLVTAPPPAAPGS